VKPSRNLMINNRDAITGDKIESKQQRHRKLQVTTVIREFSFRLCQEKKAMNLTPEGEVRPNCEKMLNERADRDD
jgi:hypothetical protein